MAWSKELQNRTRYDIFPGAIVKDDHWNFGAYFPEADGSITLNGVETKNYMPVPTNEVIATFKNKEAMIAAGWVID